MKTSRTLQITDVIISPENILDIGTRVYEEYSRSTVQYKDFEIILNCSNNTRYEFKKEEFNIEEIKRKLQERRVKGLEINFYGRSQDIRIDLTHLTGDGFFENKIVISGNDEMWVNGIVETMKDLIAHWQKQPSVNFFKSFWFYSIGILFLIIPLCFFCMRFPSFKNLSSSAQGAVATIISVLAMFFMWWVVDAIKELYPKVELLTGPEYLQVAPNKRKKFIGFLILVLLPCILTIIVGIIQHVLEIPR